MSSTTRRSMQLLLAFGFATAPPLLGQRLADSRVALTQSTAPTSAPFTDNARRVQIPVAHRSNAPWIGAAIGAVALPAAGYLAFHDRDSGSPNAGGLLLIGAIGAVLGYMVGLMAGHQVSQ